MALMKDRKMAFEMVAALGYSLPDLELHHIPMDSIEGSLLRRMAKHHNLVD